MHPIAFDLLKNGWFSKPGAYVLVDGQYGSTGKGLLASVLADHGPALRVSHVTTNAGPNSGHTAYCPFTGNKVMTQQLPIFSVITGAIGRMPITYLNGGSIIDVDILLREIRDYMFDPYNLVVHPAAAIIQEQDREREASGTVAAVASTGKGVGAALARKILRENNVARALIKPNFDIKVDDIKWDWSKDIVFVETAQGFSLGINSQFYPHTTSRECTVMQALSDAKIPAQKLNKVAMTLRTYPIRVGNTEAGHSGKVYKDQKELSWESLDLPVEYTSVTKRVRRVFSWSWEQFSDAVRTNRPDLLFINFIQYHKTSAARERFVDAVCREYWNELGHYPETVLLGYGPKNEDVYLYEKGMRWTAGDCGGSECLPL